MAAIRVRRGSRRGAKVFERECKTCHKIGEQGFALGPDLTGSPSRDPAALLANILDPNASVPPKDVQYVVVDQNGRTLFRDHRIPDGDQLDAPARRGSPGYHPAQPG